MNKSTKRKTTRLIEAAAMVALVSLSARSSQAVTIEPGTALAPKQEITRQLLAEIESLDPARIESTNANLVGLDVFEGLTRIDAAGNVVPGVAASWTRIAPDTWVFKLRHDAQWSDGHPVTAADFVYAWQRVADPKTASPYTVTVEFVKNAKAVIAGKQPLTNLGVRAIDPYTLEVRTEAPTPFFTELTANSSLAPVDRATVAKYGANWTRPGNLVSNGPYTLADWRPNDRIVLVRNPHYWNNAHVPITKVTWMPVESDETAMRMFQSGQIDMTYQLPTGQYSQLVKTFGAELKPSLQIGTYYYSLNNNDPALRDPRVRQALSMVLDRDLLTSKITQNGERPVYGLIVDGTKGAQPFMPDWAAWPMAKRVEAARTLLKAAGVSDAKPLSFTMIYNTNEQHKKVALFASSEWRTKLGVNAKIENLEFKVLLKQRHDGAFQLARDGWYADYNDAMSFFGLIQCGSPQNDQRFCNPKVDDQVAQANLQSDDAKRREMLTQAFALAMRDTPLLPLYQYSAARLVKSYVGGYKLTNNIDQRASQDMYILKH
ncbi:oligopeptide transport system substrate-binding protein [Paraburkholderia bannensis]|uniref:Oligopeptide transport system substrate-binding protein n=1 Tax=Paraburkholderia bannensis TaxID=765414 RepID=A0A7W9U2D4_9BURK|nr:oligopeptide transport system substrate-binding protein [Paraburkholderia sp. WP4_3_2]MBB6105768.1 oligopeptide transport system substrate-binding protein [Paraburkholderia bannensis]